MCRAVLPGFPCCQTAVMGGLVQNELFSLSPFTWQEELSVRLGAHSSMQHPACCRARCQPSCSTDCKQWEACGVMFNFFVMPVALFTGVAFSVRPKALCGSA